MKHYSIILLSVIGLLFTACEAKFKPEQLHGNWQAVYIKHGDDVISAGIVKAMGFEFKADKSYSYSASTTELEEGNFWIEGDLLFTEGENVMKKAVKIEKLSADSLVLGMNDKGTSMTMIFVKE